MKKAFKILGFAALGFIALCIVIGLTVDLPATSAVAKPAEEVAEQVTTSPEPTPATIIPGLNPVDVYLTLEKRGFTVSKNLKPGQLSWTCKQSWPSVEFSAEVFGPEVDEVSFVRAEVMADGVNKTALAGRDYLAMMASAPYTGSQPQVAHEWVVANFDQDGATTTIGGTSFTLRAPSEVYRMLTIQPAP